LRIFETLCDFGPVMKTRATMMASPLSPDQCCLYWGDVEHRHIATLF